ncbi:MAG: AraC family transcriptional regulator [Firmicutes bacterium]|nr:AraC family transcriptional regulator [Bacillota bacterium]
MIKAWQNISDTDFRLPLSDPEVFKKSLEKLPIPVHVHTPDGIVVFLNAAGRAEFGVGPEEVTGRYNFFKDSEVASAIRVGEIKRVLAGETVLFPSVKFSFGSGAYRDVTVFPLMEKGYVTHVVVVQAPCRVHKSKSEIERAKEFLFEHWYQKFDLNCVVSASGLSKAHFSRLFKTSTGKTPYEFYTDIKIAKLKERLSDAGLSLEEAFAACNLSVGGYFARVFKRVTGVSVVEYRKSALRSEKK